MYEIFVKIKKNQHHFSKLSWAFTVALYVILHVHPTRTDGVEGESEDVANKPLRVAAQACLGPK